MMDLARFVVAAVERVPLGALDVAARPGGQPRYHPRLMLALLIHSYANAIFSSRKIERATYRDVAMRFVAASLHPDHDTIATFRRANKAAFEAAFLQVLLLARRAGLLRLGTVSIDGTKIDAIASWRSDCEAADGGATGGASKIRSVRYDRARELRAKLAADIAALTARAEVADAERCDPQALPEELARREALHARLDAACERLEADARAEAEASRPAYVEALAARSVEPLVAIGRTRLHRPYDFCPPPLQKTPRRITEPWRIAMKAKPETDDAKALCKKHKQTIEPVFGIIKSAMGFTRLPARPAQGRHRAELDRPDLQLQAATPPAVRLNLSTPNYRKPQSDRLLGGLFGLRHW